jgi:hypothetical protein
VTTVVRQASVTRVPATQPAARTTVAVTPRQPACVGASAISQRYINSGADLPVRCGPQATTGATTSAPAASRQAGTVYGATPRATAAPRAVPAPVIRRTPVQTYAPAIRRVPAQTVTNGQTRVVPRHVYDNRRLDNVFEVPEGYRSVWDDDRLNPRRAEQTLQGIASSRLVWTNRVPHRLIEQKTGRDVTATVPLIYPYTDSATQQRELGSVTIVQRNGLVVKRVVRNNAAVRQPTVSSRSAPAPVVRPQSQAQAQAQAQSQPKATAKGRYVQVGAYANRSNAQTAAQRLARTGLPARMGTLKRGGNSYQVVLAGPFDSAAGLQRALGQARAAGFSDAFVRN